MSNKYQKITTILQNEEIAPDIFRMVFNIPEIALEASPGQFIHLKINNGFNDPLLRRPFSLFYADTIQGNLTIVYQVVGRGSEILSTRKIGSKVDVLGPLGNGFDRTGLKENPEKRALLVGGGVGIPPLFFLSTQIVYTEENPCKVLIGAAASAKILGKSDFHDHAIPIEIATDDGSEGHHGLVTDLLRDELQKKEPAEVFACGPLPMLKSVALLCREYGVPCQVSMEARMGCGVGACLGCTIPKANGEGYILACHDGPVVRAEEVAW